ncbi:MAG: hypothetical protein KGH72_01405 [Candidatus Micrarchaeota archaeon]|nr:hypothetical protein [Candidatus Micrarchaeota archaeon]
MEYEDLARTVARQTLPGNRNGTVWQGDVESAALVALAECVLTYDSSFGMPFKDFAHFKLRSAAVDEVRHIFGKKSRETGVAAQDGYGAPWEHEANVFPFQYHQKPRLIASDIAPEAEGKAMGEEGYSHVEGYDSALSMLSMIVDPRVREVAVKHVLGDIPLREVGESMGITESRACQLMSIARKDMEDGLALEEHGILTQSSIELLRSLVDDMHSNWNLRELAEKLGTYKDHVLANIMRLAKHGFISVDYDGAGRVMGIELREDRVKPLLESEQGSGSG